MKHKKSALNRIFYLFGILILTLVIVGIGFYRYLFSMPQILGPNTPSSPVQITRNFSLWLDVKDGEVTLDPTVARQLDETGMWIQVIDEAGSEVFSHNKPRNVPTHYRTSQLVMINSNNEHDDYTIFTSSKVLPGETMTYLVGFPYRIGRFTFVYNGERGERFRPIFNQIMIVFICVLFLLVCGYVFWLSKHLSKIVKGVNDISSRNYRQLKETGAFGEIYQSINLMNQHMLKSDEANLETERIRQEWIVNITHDLKTPLSTIKGYAELLTDHSNSEVKESGLIISKNVGHTEVLINDMKLTYQLESNTIPFSPQPIKINRYIKETVIDIINNPLFTGRKLGFESHDLEIEAQIDPNLFYRAVQNIIINALIHNPLNTTVKVTLKIPNPNEWQIIIKDNGNGMDKETCLRLFDRYYRGTDTKQRTEGSGLGMAIAKQIIQLHEGEIVVHSEMGIGTTFVVTLPIKAK